MVGAPAHLGAVDHDRTRARRDHAATAGGFRVEGGAQWLEIRSLVTVRGTGHSPSFYLEPPGRPRGTMARRLENANAIVPQYPQECTPSSSLACGVARGHHMAEAGKPGRHPRKKHPNPASFCLPYELSWSKEGFAVRGRHSRAAPWQMESSP